LVWWSPRSGVDQSETDRCGAEIEGFTEAGKIYQAGLNPAVEPERWKKEAEKYEPSSGTSPTNLSFTAIVGQEEMKLALILNVIDPKSVAS
jgi:hypothetical protein